MATVDLRWRHAHHPALRSCCGRRAGIVFGQLARQDSLDGWLQLAPVELQRTPRGPSRRRLGAAALVVEDVRVLLDNEPLARIRVLLPANWGNKLK